ncbi:MAG: alpha/beta hydrolase [Candidatus Omnitrophica bacterium]|nr:alpha/beta hydrolase [Candidatus Omnitrophota bacterium]
MSCIKGEFKTGRFLVPYRIYENNGPHIVCVNGVQQSMAMWHTFVRRFSRDYRIALFDFPDQGKGKIFSGPARLSFDEQVELLFKVMEKTKTSPNVTLCAASWGGVVAVGFAAKYGEMIKRLILASLGTKPNKNMVETIKIGTKMDMKNRQEMARVLIKSFGENLTKQFKEKIISQFNTMSDESLRAFCEHGLFVIASKKLTDLVDLKKIKAKTILLNGEKDTIIDLDDVKSLACQIPNCEMKIIKGVGHFLHMEREEVLDIYAEILSSR